jgi:hypothetical protein
MFRISRSSADMFSSTLVPWVYTWSSREECCVFQDGRAVVIQLNDQGNVHGCIQAGFVKHTSSDYLCALVQHKVTLLGSANPKHHA